MGFLHTYTSTHLSYDFGLEVLPLVAMKNLQNPEPAETLLNQSLRYHNGPE